MRSFLLSIALIFGVSVVHADETKLHGNIDAARAIAKAEADFAALAKREGTAKAFRDYMDEVDGVIYGGGSEPAIGRDASKLARPGRRDTC